MNNKDQMIAQYIDIEDIMVQHSKIRSKITLTFAKKLCDLMEWEYIAHDWELVKGVSISITIVEKDK